MNWIIILGKLGLTTLIVCQFLGCALGFGENWKRYNVTNRLAIGFLVAFMGVTMACAEYCLWSL